MGGVVGGGRPTGQQLSVEAAAGLAMGMTSGLGYWGDCQDTRSSYNGIITTRIPDVGSWCD